MINLDNQKFLLKRICLKDEYATRCEWEHSHLHIDFSIQNVHLVKCSKHTQILNECKLHMKIVAIDNEMETDLSLA